MCYRLQVDALAGEVKQLENNTQKLSKQVQNSEEQLKAQFTEFLQVSRDPAHFAPQHGGSHDAEDGVMCATCSDRDQGPMDPPNRSDRNGIVTVPRGPQTKFCQTFANGSRETTKAKPQSVSQIPLHQHQI